MITPHGKLVKVKGKNMHVRQMGSGEKIIVLLPGLGCPLPTVEFAPLMRELSKKYTVCTIELFGYGHSDSIDTPRTNENYVKEIREALTLAGLNPPYVLMPYSASSIYAEYYAAKYPSEIEGLILLDGSNTLEVTAKAWTYTEDMIKEMYGELEANESSGKTPAMLAEMELIEQGHTPEDIKNLVEKAIAEFIEHGYTLDEIEELDKIPNHDRTLLEQDIALSANVYEVLALPIPKNIPILAFHSEMTDFDDDERIEYEQYRKDHIARLGENVKRVVVIEGSTHSDISYHRDYRKIISQEIDVFLR